MQCNVYIVLNSPDKAALYFSGLSLFPLHTYRDKKGDFTLSNVKDVTKTKLNS